MIQNRSTWPSRGFGRRAVIEPALDREERLAQRAARAMDSRLAEDEFRDAREPQQGRGAQRRARRPRAPRHAEGAHGAGSPPAVQFGHRPPTATGRTG